MPRPHDTERYELSDAEIAEEVEAAVDAPDEGLVRMLIESQCGEHLTEGTLRQFGHGGGGRGTAGAERR